MNNSNRPRRIKGLGEGQGHVGLPAVNCTLQRLKRHDVGWHRIPVADTDPVLLCLALLVVDFNGPAMASNAGDACGLPDQTVADEKGWVVR